MGFKHVIPHLVERFLDGESPPECTDTIKLELFRIDDTVEELF